MKEQILNTFAAMGFQLEEMEGFGYGFRYEGINYLYMPNDDDEDFLNIAVPAQLYAEVRKGKQTGRQYVAVL